MSFAFMKKRWTSWLVACNVQELCFRRDLLIFTLYTKYVPGYKGSTTIRKFEGGGGGGGGGGEMPPKKPFKKLISLVSLHVLFLSVTAMLSNYVRMYL